ncbi:MAG: hypothetical protein ACRDHU_15340 [Actinomycetota bacterium]
MGVALNLVLEAISRRAQEAAESRDRAWEGLTEAETIVQNELSRWGLIPVAPAHVEFHRRLEERDPKDSQYE